MKEPVVIINGESTERNNTIPYTGIVDVDVEILKTEIMREISRRISYLYGIDIKNIYFILNSISIDAYKYILTHGTEDTEALSSLAQVIHYQLQFVDVHISIDNLINIISNYTMC